MSLQSLQAQVLLKPKLRFGTRQSLSSGALTLLISFNPLAEFAQAPDLSFLLNARVLPPPPWLLVSCLSVGRSLQMPHNGFSHCDSCPCQDRHPKTLSSNITPVIFFPFLSPFDDSPEPIQHGLAPAL